MGNVVANTVVRMSIRKAVGKVRKTAKSVRGKRKNS